MVDRLVSLGELRRGDAGEYGAKAANLGELIGAGFEVPPGFVVPAAMCRTDGPELAARLGVALAELGAHSVAVRSSALGEDSMASSYAGVFDTFTDIVVSSGAGVDAVAAAVRGCWASLDSPRAAAYRGAGGLPEVSAMAVVVQKMIDAELSGVGFSVDPVSGDTDTLLIESVSGAGSALMSGTARPERFRVATSKVESGVDSDGGEREAMLSEVAGTVVGIEDQFGAPVDVEWCWSAGILYLVQVRPITRVGSQGRDDGPGSRSDEHLVLRGEGASPGVSTGPVRVVTEIDMIDQVIEGDVLVTPFTSPEWMPALVRCVALVTEVGGVTSHAAIVSRELDLPCVVGAERATTVLATGDHVTVDGSSGAVRRGS